jgi:hypothetical protein
MHERVKILGDTAGDHANRFSLFSILAVLFTKDGHFDVYDTIVGVLIAFPFFGLLHHRFTLLQRLEIGASAGIAFLFISGVFFEGYYATKPWFYNEIRLLPKTYGRDLLFFSLWLIVSIIVSLALARAHPGGDTPTADDSVGMHEGSDAPSRDNV